MLRCSNRPFATVERSQSLVLRGIWFCKVGSVPRAPERISKFRVAFSIDGPGFERLKIWQRKMEMAYI